MVKKIKTKKPETTYQAILGQSLRKLRKDKQAACKTKAEEKKWTQKSIASELEIDESTWSKIENGTKAISLRQLQKIAEKFGKSATDILKDADTVASQLKSMGYDVIYDPIEEQEISFGKGLALISGVALGFLIKSILK